MRILLTAKCKTKQVLLVTDWKLEVLEWKLQVKYLNYPQKHIKIYPSFSLPLWYSDFELSLEKKKRKMKIFTEFFY